MRLCKTIVYFHEMFFIKISRKYSVPFQDIAAFKFKLGLVIVVILCFVTAMQMLTLHASRKIQTSYFHVNLTSLYLL